MDVENQDLPNDPAVDPEREDLLAALREAGGTAAVADQVATEEAAAAARREAGTEPAPAEPVADDEPKVMAILREREKKTAEIDGAKSHVSELIARAQAQADQLIKDAQERASRLEAEEKEKLRQRFRSSPSATLRELGDPQEISDAVMREGTPEARHIRMLEERLAATEKRAEAGERVSKDLDSFRQELAQAKQAEYVEKIRTDYMATATKDTAPYLNALYPDQDEIFARANRVAADWRKRGAVLGTDFDFADVTRHLEKDARSRFTSLTGAPPAQQVSAGAPLGEPGNAPKVPANGTRTLSAAHGSERRNSPKPVSEMTKDEERQALIDEVAAARRANPNAKL